jgi:ADP-ribosylglycohydrolase
MLPTLDVLRQRLRGVVRDKCAQGHVVDGLAEEIDRLPASYDAMADFGRRLADLPLRPDWPYVEPSGLDEIWAECDPGRPLGPVGSLGREDAAARVEAAFLGSVAGCMLGKPVEVDPTMESLRAALEPLGEWPIRDYVPAALGPALPHLQHWWEVLTRETLTAVVPDDDINYTVLGMLLLEQHGLGFTTENVWRLWTDQLPTGQTWGAERTSLLKAGMALVEAADGGGPDEWVSFINPGEEACGAMIRVDAYGYACPGRPALAAELAWRDAAFTHRRTGIYGAMWLAAALAVAPVCDDPLEPFEVANQFVPQRSRFAEIARHSLAEVRAASDWEDAYRRIHARYADYRCCAIYQELGTVMNSMRFATDVGDGFCKQVMQGLDTDSYGARVGSLLGLYFGPGHLEDRWLAPLNDDFRVGLALFYERSLAGVAQRMGRLPALTL